MPTLRTIAAAPPRKDTLRVAAYCRVSTLLETQGPSLEIQRSHFEQYIRTHPGWVSAGVYLEAGVSATGVGGRPALQKLLADCGAGRIDLIVTKSVSRFARNTTDCLSMVRQLTALGVAIRFEKERIDTGTMGSEFMLAVLACLAEDESRSLSGNLKWGLRKRFEAGTYKPVAAPYGYVREGGAWRVVPEQAAVVRRIFDAVLSGKGMRAIADELNAEGVPTLRGAQWRQSTLRRMVGNPAYIGDMLCQKTYTDEFFTRRVNRGEIDQFYSRGHHEPIVSETAFRRAALSIRQRGRAFGSRTVGENAEQAARRGARYAFSGRLKCAVCGAVMLRQKGKYHDTYRCPRRGCEALPVMEDDVKNAFLTCLNKLAWSQGLPPRERLLDLYIRGLRAEGSSDAILRAAAALREFIGDWRVTADTAAFPDEAFTRFAESASVARGGFAVFRFFCGLTLSEALGRASV